MWNEIMVGRFIAVDRNRQDFDSRSTIAADMREAAAPLAPPSDARPRRIDLRKVVFGR